MDYYSSQINKLIQELSESLNRREVCTASGVSYPEYAGGAGRRTFRGNYQCQEECPVLQGMFYTDRRWTVPYLQRCLQKPQDDHGGWEYKGSCRYEKTQKYDGVYHVLHGAISPMLGIGPNDIKLKELMQMITAGCGRGDHCHELQPWGRDNCNVYQQINKTNRYQSDQDRQRCAGRRRFGIYRWSDIASCTWGADGALI